MIDIVMKNVQQIGTPTEENRIYIASSAYDKMHKKDFQRKVYVLMGHTQSNGTKYATFVEGAIEVEDIEFRNNVPWWNNNVWSNIFKVINNFYEDSIIVGWAIEINGLLPAKSEELEMVHKEQFGGRHQLLFLMNGQEREEYFFTNRNQHLYKKEGFFIYYKKDKLEMTKSENVGSWESQKSNRNFEIELPNEIVRRKGAYRELLKGGGENEVRQSGGKGLSGLMVGIVAALVLAIGLKLLGGAGIDDINSLKEKYLPASGSGIEINSSTSEAEEASTEDVVPVKIIDIKE